MRMNSSWLRSSAYHVGPRLLTDPCPRGLPLRKTPQIAAHRCRPRSFHVDTRSDPTSSQNVAASVPDNYVATRVDTTPVSIPGVDINPIPGHRHLNQQPLPVSCPGCGAFSQEVSPDEAGYYTRSRKAVKSYLRSLRDAETQREPILQPGDADAFTRAQPQDEKSLIDAANDAERAAVQQTLSIQDVPVCDRCHDLIYNSRGTSIAHPTIEAIADSIAESPFRRNHVYHVVDAADFPLSLIPSIFKTLSLAKPRSQNRRSQHDFSQKPTLSFIITRSDLLAPTKETVDSLMTYMTSVLRQALGRFARDIRLGNVHLVSAKRGWWTADIKDSIWTRGGGNWMVGKVNVGKSNLFEVLFPKGSGERAPSHAELEKEAKADKQADSYNESNDLLSETSLLPPAQPETAFPTLPLVSSLPGTTASPIRLPFGNHRGELIDLPGLGRGNLEDFVLPEHKQSLVMTHRPTVTQHVLKPGQSLLLGGGLVRITPLLDEADRSMTMLAYPFVPIDAHVTSTEKAIGAQLQQRQSGFRTILEDGAGEKMRLAGKFKLDTDVTRGRARALIDAGVDLEKLPFRVYATDIVVEGVGWVELVCQVRRQRNPFPILLSNATSIDATTTQSTGPGEVTEDVDDAAHVDSQASPNEAEPADALSQLQSLSSNSSSFCFPEVEVHTPNGSHVGKRRSMGAWLLLESGRRKKAKKAASGARPRKSMKGAKKREKSERRAHEATAIVASGRD